MNRFIATIPSFANWERRDRSRDGSGLNGAVTRGIAEEMCPELECALPKQNIDLAMGLIPQEDEIPWIPDQAWAEDAAVAIVYALYTRQNGKSQDSVWAARRAYDAGDHFVTTQEDIDPSDAGAEEWIISNPLVQAEFMRQQRDLRELVAVEPQHKSALVQKIRQPAKQNPPVYSTRIRN